MSHIGIERLGAGHRQHDGAEQDESVPGIVGQQLRSFRIERGFSQGELSDRADVSVDLISKLEQGVRQTARFSSLTRLANALDIDLGRLLEVRRRGLLDECLHAYGYYSRDAILGVNWQLL